MLYILFVFSRTHWLLFIISLLINEQLLLILIYDEFTMQNMWRDIYLIGKSFKLQKYKVILVLLTSSSVFKNYGKSLAKLLTFFRDLKSSFDKITCTCFFLWRTNEKKTAISRAWMDIVAVLSLCDVTKRITARSYSVRRKKKLEREYSRRQYIHSVLTKFFIMFKIEVIK